MKKYFFLFCFMFFSIESHSRVFQFKKETLGSFLRMDGLMSHIGQSPYQLANGNAITYSAGVDYNISGEIGFFYRVQQITFVIGMEMVQTQKLGTISGVGADGKTLFTLNSSVSSTAPNVHIEYQLFMENDRRVYMSLGSGQATMVLQNDYTFTTDGQSAYPGVNNYSEQAETTLYTGIIAFGYERVLADTATISFDMGCRMLLGNDLSYNKAIALTTLGKSIKVGDSLLDASGSPRELNLGGYFFGMTIRFYIDFI